MRQCVTNRMFIGADGGNDELSTDATAFPAHGVVAGDKWLE